MGAPNRSKVYEWLNERGEPCYVGWGVCTPDYLPPWLQRWQQRHNDDSELGAYLRACKAPPALSWSHLPKVPLCRSAAAQVAAMRRRELKAIGVKLLRDRTYVGSGPMIGVKAVMPDGRVRLCRSVRSAGRILGVSHEWVRQAIMTKKPILTDLGLIWVNID